MRASDILETGKSGGGRGRDCRIWSEMTKLTEIPLLAISRGQGLGVVKHVYGPNPGSNGFRGLIGAQI